MPLKNSDFSRGSSPIHRPVHGGNLVWAASLANCSPSAILDFSASINPLGPPRSALSAIQDHLADIQTYPDPQYSQLRQALSQFHQVSPEWILPGNGAAELLTWACRDLATQAGVTYLLTPAFSDYLRALKSFNANVQLISISLPADSEATSPEGLACARLDRLLTAPQHQGDALASSSGFLLNNPHNPTGILFSRDQIVAWLKEQQVTLLVVDEAFMDFLPPDQQQSVIDLVPEYPNLVVLRSLTKFYSMPGLRLGYAIAHPDRLQRWQEWRDPWSVNALAAAVGEVVVQDVEFQQQTWEWLATARLYLQQGLARISGLTPYAGAANFLLVKSARSVTQLQAELLQRHQILIRDCLSFPDLGDRYFRVAVRTHQENQRLLGGLSDVLSA